MKWIGKHTPIMPLLIVALALFIGLGASDALSVSFGGHEINFLGATYDPGANATTFTYRAIAATNWGFDFWILALNPECFGAGDIMDASESFEYTVDDQIIPPILGIKFTQPYGPGESRDVSFRLSGDLSTALVRVVLREAGCTYHEREIEGPECGPGQPPQCDVTPDRAVCVGSDATFMDNTTGGTPPYTYCWQKEFYTDPCISTTNQLTISDATLADAGTYRLIVTDALDYADTCYAELIVYPAPECDVTPPSQEVPVGSDATFTDNTTGGTPPYTWCWQKEPYTDPCISTTNQLTIFGVTLADAGTYRVIVTDAYDCADTCYAVLRVPPPTGEGKSPGYWGNQLAIYLGYKNGKLKEPDVASYAAQYGYTAEQAYDIMLTGEGGTPVEKLHRQLVAAKLSTAAGYLSGMDELLEWGQYIVAHPGEFTEQEILDAKNFFESLHD